MKQADKIALKRYLTQLDLVSKSGDINPFESKDDKKARIERAKKDIKYMVEYYFPHYADSECADFHLYWVMKVKMDPHFKGFSKWGRGLAKSVWNTIFIPFWLHINGEETYLLTVGQNETKAKQLLDDIRAEFEANPRIINDFGEQKTLGSWESGFFITKSGFIGQAVGMGQSCRGLRVKHRRPSFINIDDTETKEIVKNVKRQKEYVEWVESELLPTMDGAWERLVISNNWFAPNMYIRTLAEKHPDWFVHEVKAYDAVTYEPAWKSKYTADYYRNKEKAMGVSSAHAEYLHIARIIGDIFKEELTQWSKIPRIDHFTAIALHWDIAYAGNPTSDYNAVRVWGLYKNNFYYIDSFVMQSKMAPAIKWIAQFKKQFPKASILTRAEAQFWNDAVRDEIRKVEKEEEMQLKITLVYPPKVRKYDRIVSGLEAYWQNGRMFWNKLKKAHKSTEIGLQQLYGIEPGYKTHDDAPDADQQCIAELEKHISYGDSKKHRIRTGKVPSKNVA